MNGINTFHEYDPLSNETTIIHVGDASATLEDNKVKANSAEYTKRGLKNEFMLYASIPAIVQTKLLIEHGIDVYNTDHAERLFKILNDPEYKYLKTTHLTHRPKKT